MSILCHSRGKLLKFLLTFKWRHLLSISILHKFFRNVKCGVLLTVEINYRLLSDSKHISIYHRKWLDVFWFVLKKMKLSVTYRRTIRSKYENQSIDHKRFQLRKVIEVSREKYKDQRHEIVLYFVVYLSNEWNIVREKTRHALSSCKMCCYFILFHYSSFEDYWSFDF